MMMMPGWGWGYMGAFGLGAWLVMLAMALLFLYPIGRILDRLGVSPLWSLVALVPLLNLIALWVLAFADWPRVRRAA
ncbi:MAG TPA: hypothetical protein VGR91_02935 [Stellaceae bacterium]|nr:hypothetical protein [Stellaceae bacterium]